MERLPKRPTWLTPALSWGAVVVAALMLGAYASPPAPPNGMPVGRMLPRMPGPPPDFRTLLYQLGVGSAVWYSVVIAFPLLLWGARRVDVERHGRGRVVAGAIATIVLLIGASSVVQYVVMYHDIAPRPRLAMFIPFALRQTVLPWIAVTGIVVAIESRRRSVQAAVERERLRAQIAEQRLVALTGQLHPHFLFNTLQGISTLIHRDPEAADEMLAKLSDLLRDLLRHRERAIVPLEDEIRYARTYLEIAHLRFADRLTFDIDVATGLEQSSVPLFILQPLVENALAHGIGPRGAGGRVSLKAWRSNGRLAMEVTDDGAGLPSNGSIREGIGLSNTRERLRATFGADHDFSLCAAKGGGVVAHIEIPFREYSAL
ncbi:MAG TPA: histidine kinase [Gemmatimonadaceae bacterium]